ncbi:IS1380 family transposase [Kitasatospora sp. MBT66]|uniref:IS1380 family transposase n=1 Tax=Kitasatospora sp. MBT66 TaxID=1444769 RepID=UPI0005BA04F2|nr:IS1380 family transposase [Kitasatospora sp. MBT66]
MSADGKGQVGHVGGVHLRLLAERTGLTGALSAALARRGFHPLHDRGQVMVDLAVAITLGATCIRDVRLLEHQRAVFGPVASFPTVWRTLSEVDELALRRIDRTRATVRRHVYALLRDRPEGFPEVEVDGAVLSGWTVIDSDGTLISAPSEKEGACGTYKGTFGHHVFVATCDNTGEQLATRLYPGNVTANDASVNIDILTRAVAQLPWWRRQKILFRVDGAGFSHELLTWISSAGGRASATFRWEYSIGWSFTEREQAAIETVDRLGLWQPATGEGGQAREDAFVADITGLLGDLTGWPQRHRVIARKEPLHPRYLKDASAYETTKQARYQTFATNSRRRQIAHLDARHRKHARVEPKIRDQKASGMGLLPSREMNVNAAWLTATAIAADLRAWLQLLALDGENAKATPKTLRYRILHVPARLVRGQRKRHLKLPATWPWAAAILRAFTRILALPHPT